LFSALRISLGGRSLGVVLFIVRCVFGDLTVLLLVVVCHDFRQIGLAILGTCRRSSVHAFSVLTSCRVEWYKESREINTVQLVPSDAGRRAGYQRAAGLGRHRRRTHLGARRLRRVAGALRTL